MAKISLKWRVMILQKKSGLTWAEFKPLKDLMIFRNNNKSQKLIEIFNNHKLNL